MLFPREGLQGLPLAQLYTTESNSFAIQNIYAVNLTPLRHTLTAHKIEYEGPTRNPSKYAIWQRVLL
jgi:hypothetical protein